MPFDGGHIAGLRPLLLGDPINKGLLGWWPMNEAGGGVARDITGFRRHGTLTNFTGTATSGWGVGPHGRALNFDGTNDHVPVVDFPTPPFITISAWVNAGAGGSGIVLNKNYNGASVPYSLCVANNGTFGGFAFFNGGWRKSGVVTDIRGDGNWHFVVGSYDGATLRYYIDGRLDSSFAYAGTLPTATNAQPPRIGVYLNDGAYYAGSMLGLRVHSRVLGLSDIMRLRRERYAGLGPAILPNRRTFLLLSGGAPALTHYTLTLGTGAFTLTGQPIALRASRRLPLAAGAFSLAGQPVALRVARRLALAAGSFTLSGQAIGLLAGRRLAVSPGAFLLTGQAITLRAARKLPLAAGAFTLTGQPVALRAGRRLGLAAGSFALSGQAIALRASRRLALGSGAFALTGRALALVYSGAEVVAPPASRTYRIPAQPRAYAVAAGARSYTLPAAPRRYTVQPEG